MSWLYQPLLPGGAQRQSGTGTDTLEADSIASGTPVVGMPALGEPGAERFGGAGVFTPAEIAGHKARQRRFLQGLPSSKLSPDEVALLARLMQEMRSLQTLPPAEREPEIAREVEVAVAETLAKPEVKRQAAKATPFTPAAAPKEDSLAAEIEAMRSTIARMIAAREEAEEDDIETLMLLVA